MPKASFSIDVKVSGDQIFDLSSFAKVQGKPNSTARMLLHRVAANVADLCARSIQEAFIDEMAKKLTIRQKHSRGRAPSYIQNQIKYERKDRPKASSFPNIKATLTIKAVPENSRGRTPIILDMLNEGAMRGPFKTGGGKGEYVPMPITENVRQGGVWQGKVKPKLYYDKIAKTMEEGQAGFIKDKRTPNRTMRYVSTDKKTYIVRTKNGRLAVFRAPEGMERKDAIKNRAGEMLYILDKTRPVPKLLDFFDTARNTLNGVAQKHFDDLVANGGDNRTLLAQFKYNWRP